MVSLTNSKSCQDVLGQQLSEAIALGSYELKTDERLITAQCLVVARQEGEESLTARNIVYSEKFTKIYNII